MVAQSLNAKLNDELIMDRANKQIKNVIIKEKENNRKKLSSDITNAKDSALQPETADPLHQTKIGTSLRRQQIFSN